MVAHVQHVIVDTDYVAKHKDKPGVLLVDVRTASDCMKGVIPDAVVIGKKGGAVELRDVDARILPVAALEKMLGDAGISRENEIIVYGAKGDTGPAVVFWILEYLGAEKAKVYMGGIDDWIRARLPITSDIRNLPSARFVAKVRPELIATTDFVKANLTNKDIQFLDSRTAKESAGDDIRSVRGGHIAAVNHVNIPYEQNWVDPDAARKLAEKSVHDRDGMALKDIAALKELYKKFDPRKEVVAYCQSGTRSTFVYAVLRELGFERVRNYDDSWVVWGADVNLPVDDVSYFDFVKVNAAMKRLEALEKQVAALSDRK